ncbi:cyclic nucleotide gated channel 5 [Striga asiatica]|uniref:Cyclic nucleotide gated channel 5 n=1 Tax=Striga asiatica TaxID=4170 RepID=A0A5A7QLB6_STRAF|nr:cyclic nucleotide gated channel 5 [Striga asiatica]
MKAKHQQDFTSARFFAKCDPSFVSLCLGVIIEEFFFFLPRKERLIRYEWNTYNETSKERARERTNITLLRSGRGINYSQGEFFIELRVGLRADLFQHFIDLDLSYHNISKIFPLTLGLLLRSVLRWEADTSMNEKKERMIQHFIIRSGTDFARQEQLLRSKRPYC